MTWVPRPFRALLGYAAITVALAFPLVLQLGTVVANDLGDPLLNTWILWWNSQRVPLSAAWWNGPAFFPSPDMLALSEHLLGLSFFTTPIIWLTGNVALGYNLAFLLTFVLSAMGAYVLGVVLTKRHDVAFVIGLLYGFAPYRMAQFAHVQVMASFGMPFALAGLHKYLEEARPRWLALFGVATVLQGLTNGYYLLFFSVLVVLWILWFLPPGRRLATLGAVGSTFVVSMMALMPFLMHYRAVHERYGFRRPMDEIVFFSPKVTDLMRGMADLWLWGPWLQHPGPEADIFPGLTAVLLVAAALLWTRRATPQPAVSRAPLLRWIRLLLAGIAGVFSLTALRVLLFGPWRFEWLGLHVSAQNLSRPLSQALYTWFIVAISGPGARRLWRSQSPLGFYIGATVIMWILCFGPSPRIGDVEVLYWAPYRWLMLLPGFDGLRVPARFAMLATLCLAAAAGLALARLQPRLGQTGQLILVVVAATGALAEGWRSVPLKPLPEPSILNTHDVPGAVMELPLGDPWQDVLSQYRGTGHRHPVVNGYSGYAPPHYQVLRFALEQRDPSVLVELVARGLRHVVVFHDRDVDGRWRKYAASYPGATWARTSPTQTHYELPAPEPPAPKPSLSSSLRIVRLDASPWPEDASKAADGDLATRWSSGGPQRPGEHLFAELDGVRTVTGVELALGPYQVDFPRQLVVEASRDRQAWTTVWEGGAGGLAVDAALQDLARMPILIRFPAVQARYLRLRQVGSDPEFYWTVAELTVFGGQAEHRQSASVGDRTRPWQD